ncbi:hypothetical protein N0V84_006141 [Fusarium piperis]|uniref:Histone-lysine N-methyltransferase, H3 lysine-9 specific dim-5 n=1 Tax=Fusarium piperis TaxID=1435070 RepID=A0A9W8WCD3_9HYPO|nr:hypothetical protein N0V84_006141 [Fusarium piperis]
MEKATERHFFYHGKEGYEDERDGCHWCQIRSFPTHSIIPITVVNEEDSDFLPDDFRFINNMVLGGGVEPAGDSFRSGCSCAKDGDCQYTSCLCLADLAEDDSSDDEDDDPFGDRIDGMDVDVPKVHRKAYAYHTHGSKAGLLRSKFYDSKVPIYECHQGCSCSINCPNRVVERGRTIPLQIFRTEDRGWGVRSTVHIKKGQFVDRYLGEIITSTEADRRRSQSAISQRKDVYLFALDKFTDPNSYDPRLKGPPLEVDGEFMSGPTRFINHSCDPNMRIFARVGDHADKHIHDLALFAIKDIPKGTELTFDYVDGVSNEGEEPEGDVGHMTRCLCGSKKCRKFLCNNDRVKDTNTTEGSSTRKHTTPQRRRRLAGLTSKNRVLRHRHTRRAFLRQQVSEGRGDPYQPWCGDPTCTKDGRIFSIPLSYPVNEDKCKDGLPVEDYFHDLAEAMAIMLFPRLKSAEDRTRKHFEILSFIDSPPIRTYASKVRSGLIWLRINPTDKEFDAALISTRPVFLDLMFGVKTAKRVEKIHGYITVKRVEMKKWTLHDFILRFLIFAEIWRQQETPRRKSWVIGSREAVGEFLTAVLLSYRQLYAQQCLVTRNLHMDETWDQIWQGWLERYPLPQILEGDEEDGFKLRERLNLTEEGVLQQVGYLGGIGKGGGVYTPSRNRPEEPDRTVYFW